MAKKVPVQPENFELETNTVWAFPNRGKWATHDAKYRGNWSPYIPRNVILRYSSEGDTVLDQFVGGGTTAVEAKLTGRNFIGFDINPAAVELTQKKLDFEYNTSAEISVKLGDARKLERQNVTGFSKKINSVLYSWVIHVKRVWCSRLRLKL